MSREGPRPPPAVGETLTHRGAANLRNIAYRRLSDRT
jgi:hypothetical protein